MTWADVAKLCAVFAVVGVGAWLAIEALMRRRCFTTEEKKDGRDPAPGAYPDAQPYPDADTYVDA